MMERFKSLSKRELIMLYILVMVVIVTVGVMLLIRPALSKAGDIDAKYQSSKMKAAQMKSTIGQKDDAKLQIQDYEKKIKTEKKQFQKNLKSEEVDELVTGLITDSGLTPVSLAINGQTVSSLSSLSDSGSTSSTAGSDSASSTSGTGSSGSSSSTASAGTSAGKSTAGTSSAAGTSGSSSKSSGSVTSDSTLNSGSSNSGSSSSSKSGSAGTSGSASSGSAAGYAHVQVDTAVAEASGSLADCISLIENARKTQGVRVAAFNISSVETTAATSASTLGVDSTMTSGTTGSASSAVTSSGYQLQISFEIYQIKDL